MSSRASRTEARAEAGRLAALLAGASIEISPKETRHAGELAQLLGRSAGVYIHSVPGFTAEERLESLGQLHRAGLEPVPHIAARRVTTRERTRELLRRWVGEHGVRRVLLIGGDETPPRGPYADSVQYLEEGLLPEAGIRAVGIAGYPDGHPKIGAAALEEAFERKLRAARAQGLEVYVVTQFSFEPQRVVEYCAALARRAPGVPVYVGAAGPTDPAALVRYAQRCGVTASLRAVRRFGFGLARLAAHTDPSGQLAPIARRHEVVGAASNVAGAHLFAFGGAIRTAAWMSKAIAEGSGA
jgi:methylenetetrahydrofolate reductase (NADPH)